MFFQRAIFLSTAVMILESSVFAHPGHGASEGSGETISHYLLEPTHNWAIVLLVVAISGCAISLRVRRLKRQNVLLCRSNEKQSNSSALIND